jgi:hypothetical protein
MKKVSIVGVLVGGITDIVSTFVLAIPLMVYVGLNVASVHTPKNQIHSATMAAMHGIVPMIMSFLAGTLGSVIGGYVAARIAKHDELLNGALSSYLCMAEGVYAVLAGTTSQIPLYQQIIGFLGSPALGLLGGWLRVVQQRSKIKPLTANPG